MLFSLIIGNCNVQYFTSKYFIILTKSPLKNQQNFQFCAFAASDTFLASLIILI